MYRNQVVLEGFLGRKPDIRYLISGAKVANATLATKEFWQDKQGRLVEAIEWHALVFYAERADRAELYDKGDNLHVEGKIQTRRYTNQAGQHKAVREILVTRSYRIDRLHSEDDTVGDPVPEPEPEPEPEQAEDAPSQGIVAFSDANMPEL